MKFQTGAEAAVVRYFFNFLLNPSSLTQNLGTLYVVLFTKCSTVNEIVLTTAATTLSNAGCFASRSRLKRIVKRVRYREIRISTPFRCHFLLLQELPSPPPKPAVRAAWDS